MPHERPFLEKRAMNNSRLLQTNYLLIANYTVLDHETNKVVAGT
jgi:hypothetical protein